MYLMQVVQRCSPTLHFFKTKKSIDKFVNEFEYSVDDWIDYILKDVKVKNLAIIDKSGYNVVVHK